MHRKNERGLADIKVLACRNDKLAWALKRLVNPRGMTVDKPAGGARTGKCSKRARVAGVGRC